MDPKNFRVARKHCSLRDYLENGRFEIVGNQNGDSGFIERIILFPEISEMVHVAWDKPCSWPYSRKLELIAESNVLGYEAFLNNQYEFSSEIFGELHGKKFEAFPRRVQRRVEEYDFQFCLYDFLGHFSEWDNFLQKLREMTR